MGQVRDETSRTHCRLETARPTAYFVGMTHDFPPTDDHSALIVVEAVNDEIVFIHSPAGILEASVSLPSAPCPPEEPSEIGAARIVREKTGGEVTVVRGFVTFIYEGALTGIMCAHGFVARAGGGKLLEEGPEGPARAYPIAALPATMPI